MYPQVIAASMLNRDEAMHAALLAILLQERVGSDSDSGGGLAGQLGLEMGS